MSIEFNWGNGSPAPGLPNDNFSVRWTRILPVGEGLYRFHAVVDDGVRVYVDDILVVDRWHEGGRREVVGERWISGDYHRLRIEYYEHTGRALITVWWEKVGAYASFPDWKGEYWPNLDLGGDPSLVRNDVAVDFNWGSDSPVSGLPADNFSVRWTRAWTANEGRYRFHLLADDGVRLWKGGTAFTYLPTMGYGYG
jgi:hypothetical protein